MELEKQHDDDEALETFFLEAADLEDIERIKLLPKALELNRFLNRLLNLTLRQQVRHAGLLFKVCGLGRSACSSPAARLMITIQNSQTSIFHLFELLMEELASFDKKNNMYEGKGIKDIRGNHTLISSEVIYEDPDGLAETSVITFRTDERVSFAQAREMLECYSKNAKSGFYSQRDKSNPLPPYMLVGTHQDGDLAGEACRQLAC